MNTPHALRTAQELRQVLALTRAEKSQENMNARGVLMSHIASPNDIRCSLHSREPPPGRAGAVSCHVECL